MKTKLFIIPILCILLAGAFFLGRSSLFKPKSPASLFPNFTQDKVDSIEIDQSQTKKIFIKNGNAWKEENATMAANLETINNMLKTAQELKVGEPVSNNPKKESIFGVDNQGLKVIFKSAKQTVATLYIGKRGQDYLSNFYRKEGDNNVYLSKEALDQIFTTTSSSP